MTKLIQITTTFADKDEAEIIAKLLLNNKLSACTQLLGPTISNYWWEGKIETTAEYILIIKTTDKNFDKVKALIKKNSSYELPEVIALPIVAGDEDYLDWLSNNVKEEN